MKADGLMQANKGIDILSLSRQLQEVFGEQYGSMSAKDWYGVTRDYVERQTMRYDICDDEPVMWMVAAPSPVGEI